MEWKTVFGSAARMFWSAMQCKRIRRGGDTDDEDLAFALPRNLSFVKESCFDQFSVSSQFVHKPELIKGRLQQSCIRFVMEPDTSNEVTDDSSQPNGVRGRDGEDLVSHSRRLLESFHLESSVDSPVPVKDIASTQVQGESVITPVNETLGTVQNQVMTPDSNSTEEGVFVNLMDDIDSPGDIADDLKPTSDELPFCRSPDEGAELSPVADRAALEKAIHDAARDLNANPEFRINIRTPDPRHEDRPLIAPMESESDVYQDEEFNIKRSELRKTTSLKCGKTPPGTPHRKKMVRFADAMGLDLESVRHILNKDAPPKIPPSAMADLRVGLAEDRRGVGSKYLTACFPQPGAAADFPKRVLQQKVCLENAIITDLTITGFIRVANVGFHKEVRVRFSTNDWRTFHDIGASYVLNSCDSQTDRFSFSIVAPADFDIGQRVQFAVSYQVNDAVFWDSNNGANYIFECFAKTIPTENENAWLHFL